MSEAKRCTVGLGTFIEFTFPESAQNVYLECVTLLHRLEAELSFFKSESDVGRWNTLPAGQEAEFGEHFIYLLDLSARLNFLSDGIFDPRSEAHRLGLIDETFLIRGSRVQKIKEMSLDLAGIAKGYIVDQLVAHFQKRGVSEGVINAGGDLRCWGEIERPVHIRLGQKAVSILPVQVVNAAVAGSGWEPYCTVKAESAVLADAFTKIYMASPSVAETVKQKLKAQVELVSWL